MTLAVTKGAILGGQISPGVTTGAATTSPRARSQRFDRV